ncbi:biliverdin-producing heme oxygenase [Luteimonas kalidii]|uniref:Biliverdin-producing heme oxygenase n=1 Tax=Luteimonas kalidii TaxID=3042025 RepID=A0ABT6JWE1_9GAMM|nr:biliverdin-producing heme oxygenase [Luteimonas kalidii]MDH5835012.1 biliverdin-producing heme oxygenase [Luteimonas kalidii]
MHRFAADFERTIDAVPRHSAWLARDLTALSLLPLTAEGTHRAVAGQAARLGWEYVMAGSSMGARVLLRDARALGFDPDRGARFLDRHATSDEWGALQARLQALDVDDAVRMAQAEEGARAAFALVRSCFERGFERIPVIHGKES